MKTITRIGIGLGLTAGLSFGMEQYHGKLLDATCYHQNASSKNGSEKIAAICAPTNSTTDFAIQTNGKVRIFDAAGNSKAATAVQEGIVKKGKDSDVDIAIYGTRHGDTIKVESIRGHKSLTAVH
jgi:preprotein translocase subunit SecF